jgi:hypothetical protein
VVGVGVRLESVEEVVGWVDVEEGGWVDVVEGGEVDVVEEGGVDVVEEGGVDVVEEGNVWRLWPLFFCLFFCVQLYLSVFYSSSLVPLVKWFGDLES